MDKMDRSGVQPPYGEFTFYPREGIYYLGVGKCAIQSNISQFSNKNIKVYFLKSLLNRNVTQPFFVCNVKCIHNCLTFTKQPI